MAIQRSNKILRTKKEIMVYLDISSEEIFRRFIKQGLPAVVIDGRWYAHAENLDDFFKVKTRRGIGSVPEEAE